MKSTEEFINENTMLNHCNAQVFSKYELNKLLNKFDEYLESKKENKCCDNPDIQWNRIEISIGDKKGSYKDLSYNYCNNCGATFNEEID